MKCVLTLTMTAVGAAMTHANFLSNGGFEIPGSSAFNHYQDGEVPGWTVGRGEVMEIGKPSVYAVIGAQGTNVLEIDSNRNVTVSQAVNLSQGSYEISFLFARRGVNLEGKPLDTCDFQVLWNESVIGSFSPTTSTMTRQKFTVAGLSGMNSLSFKAMGTSDSMGAILDDASIETVPEPASLTALALGIGAVLRRRKSRAHG